MATVVPGQFDDADSSDSEDKEVQSIQAKDDILLKNLQNDAAEVKGEDEIEEEDSYDYDSDWYLDDSTGKLTKGWTWNGSSNHQANRQTSNYNSAKMSTPIDKSLRKFENKINLSKLNVTDSVINKVTVKLRQKEAESYRIKDKSARQRTRVPDRRSGPSSALRPAPRRPRPGQQRAPGRRCLQPAPPSARPRDAERRAPEAAARLGPVARTRRPDAAARPAGLSLLRRDSEHPWVTPVCGGHGYHERRSHCEGGLAAQTRGIY